VELTVKTNLATAADWVFKEDVADK
jgi:hypothetical protein